jgi:arylsulfatase A-like enzyme
MGQRFTQAYADCPVCIPQRTTWVTGRNAHKNGMPSFNDRFRVHRSPNQFLGSLIQTAGYQTALVGKTHWHTEPDFNGGFETWVSFERLADEIKNRFGRPGVNYSGMGYNELNPALNPLPAAFYSTDWAVDEALRILEKRDESRPLFLWVSFTDPHPPNVIHEPYYSMYMQDDIPPPALPSWLEGRELPLGLASLWLPFPKMNARELHDARAVYYGKITNIDHQIGRLFGGLQSSGIWDDTLILYTSDHGEMLGDFGGIGKRTFFDASARVPLIVQPPKGTTNIEPGGEVSTPVSFDGLLPTLCHYAEADTPGDITGQSWHPLLGAYKECYTEEAIHGQIDDAHMYYDGHYKYLYFCEDGAELVFDMTSARPEEYELSADTNLTQRLRSALEAHLADEKHPHLSNGQLLNRNLKRPSDRALRAIDTSGWGATGAGIYPI